MEHIALIISSIVAISSIGLNLAQRRQAKADASAAITDAAINLIEPLNTRIDEMEIIIDNLKKRIRDLEAENVILKEENKQLRLELGCK